ncbi:serine hydrolase domain-containing protein [Acidovorax sp. JMULE5]|uniref:serine hydrolase domain-containing protein n=1 Tax=Acidovorax TaxID=12916 RepID=UPI0015A028C7|nr:serine hydrolase domain-containing protein [Acidovorax sp. JMULE5]QLA81898.1 class A beta-lactamase-related serine hydrolase [Acidovorax sp. JMULE5]
MNFLNFLAARGAVLSRRRWLAAAGLGTLVTACGGGSDDGADALLERLQSQASKLVSQGVVGAATGWTDSTRAQVAVAGLRRLGGTAALERGDLMAIGSNTKAMTACVAASVVDQGLLRWDSTLAQTLPGLAREALPAYQGVTLRQLLDHRAGVMAFNKPEDVAMFLGEVGTDVLTRLQAPAEVEDFFLQWLLRQAPVRGTGADPDFAYSNAGYALAARMLRAATGQDWADLLRQRVAQPLGISLFVGEPLRRGSDQPAGHALEGGQLQPQSLAGAPERAWLEILNPAGAVSLTARDDALWLQWHLHALRGDATPLPRSYLQGLQELARAPANRYALGWITHAMQGAGWLLHTGETGGFQALSLVAMDGSRAAFAHSNIATEDSIALLYESVSVLLA